MASAVTGTGNLAAAPTAYSGANSQLTQAIQTIWSKEILFQSMPILRFEQFAVKKTELGVAPGLQINFMRYNNLGFASTLTEGVRMSTNALTAQQFSITVAEQGYAIAVSELLLNASFDDVMASASRLLGRNMALYLDGQARDTLMAASSVIYGEDRSNLSAVNNWYAYGTEATSRATMTGASYLSTRTVKDAVETLATKNIPRLGETYVAFVHPHQSRRLRDLPEFIEVTKYAAPGNEKEWAAKVEAERLERERAFALLEREREYAELSQYLNRRISEEQENIAPELIDMIAGNSVDEIEQSISKLKEKTSKLLEAMTQANQQVRREMTGTRATLPPTLENNSDQQSYTPEQIASMSVADYAKNRSRLLGTAANDRNKGIFG